MESNLNPNAVVAVDVVVFTLRPATTIENRWQVLLVRRDEPAFGNKLALPGVLLLAERGILDEPKGLFSDSNLAEIRLSVERIVDISVELHGSLDDTRERHRHHPSGQRRSVEGARDRSCGRIPVSARLWHSVQCHCHADGPARSDADRNPRPRSCVG